MFNLPCTISATADFERVSFENMQLSTQGSERQRKDILKCSLRFEKLLMERKQTCSDLNDTEILADLVAKYNGFKANSAIKRWQISPDAHQAIHGIIVGMSDEARALIRYNESILRLKRHQLNETVKGCVVLEEQSAQGLVDTGPMSIFELVLSFEKRGHLDLKMTGHNIERPANVQRGEAPDSIVVSQTQHSVFKPTAVQAKSVKGTNVASFLGGKTLRSSQYLTMVWRLLDLSF
eukprot:Skav220207  [mRNA]  locus=scaffold2858:206317:210868:- [translate_table: standard]